MLKILNNSLNGITLGQRKVDLDDATLNESSCSLEFDRKHKIQSDSQVITLSSSETCDEFSLNGKIINFSNLEKFVKEENPLETFAKFLFPRQPKPKQRFSAVSIPNHS